jgi:hypothetical protein
VVKLRSPEARAVASGDFSVRDERELRMIPSAAVVRRHFASSRYTSRLSASREQDTDRERTVDDETNAAEKRHDRSINQLGNVTNDALRCERIELPVLQSCTCSIVVEVQNRWKSCGIASLKAIDCLCFDGILVIRGSVSSYYYKQMAQESIRGVTGIKQIVNELTVIEWNETRTNARFDVKPDE